MDSFYPEIVTALLREARHCGHSANPSVAGAAVSFECGVGLEFELTVVEGVVREVAYISTGCGWAVASAEALSRLVDSRSLTDLHGLDETGAELGKDLGGVPKERAPCVELALDALRKALSEYRKIQVGEWAGDKALICSCFGVSEDVIEEAAASGTANTVREIGERCRAGTGCGSCQMLIQEILDSV